MKLQKSCRGLWCYLQGPGGHNTQVGGWWLLSTRSHVLCQKGAAIRTQGFLPSGNMDLLVPYLPIFEGIQKETQTFMWKLQICNCWQVIILVFKHCTGHTKHISELNFSLATRLWPLVQILYPGSPGPQNLFLRHLSSVGSCYYFRCPAFWVVLTPSPLQT